MVRREAQPSGERDDTAGHRHCLPMNAKRKAAPPQQKEKKFVRLFSWDLDGAAFLDFTQYHRPHSEKQSAPTSEVTDTSGTSNPNSTSLQRSVHLRQAIRRYLAAHKVDAKKASKQRAKVLARLLEEFDAYPFDGPRDWICRRSFKEALRTILLEFFSDTQTGVQIRGDEVLITGDSALSGGGPGGCYRVMPAPDIPQLVTEALFWKSRKALGFLRMLAERGDRSALQKLAEIVIPLIKLINERAGADREALGDFPKGLPYWPVLKSLHHDFDDNHSALLKSLQVGSDFPFSIGEEARWTARDAIGRWAIYLCQEIEIMQDGHDVGEDSEPWEYKLEGLQPFSNETWEDWWEVAKGLLLKDYFDVVEIPELNKTVKSSADRKSPGRIRKRILQALKEKFKSMAWANKVK
jgi:hypothetical protein